MARGEGGSEWGAGGGWRRGFPTKLALGGPRLVSRVRVKLAPALHWPGDDLKVALVARALVPAGDDVPVALEGGGGGDLQGDVAHLRRVGIGEEEWGGVLSTDPARDRRHDRGGCTLRPCGSLGARKFSGLNSKLDVELVERVHGAGSGGRRRRRRKALLAASAWWRRILSVCP